MRQKIAERYELRADRIQQLEVGKVGADGLVPIEKSFVHENSDEQTGVGLARRAVVEQRVLVDARALVAVREAEAAGEDDLVVLYERHFDPRNLPPLELRLDEALQELGVQRARHNLCRRHAATVG